MSRAATRSQESRATETLPEEQRSRTATQGGPKCVHHWIIETPNGRESQGVCKRCGAKKEFANSNESVMWEQTNTLRNDLRESTRYSKTAEIRLSDEE